MLINILLALVIGKKNNQSVLTTIQLRFENADLVKKLKNSVDEANEANARKTRFLASASHDLRQPVHALGLFSDALGNEKLSSTGKQTLSFLKQSVSSLSGLLESLLDVSRLDAGIVSPSMNAIDVSQLINNISIDTKPLCLAKGLELRVHCKSCWAYSDSVLLENILRNLLSNAIRYTEHGGILLSCRQRHDEIWIEVWDTGIGISDVEQKQIFDEFYQVNNVKRDREQGLGLGLAIVQKQAVLLDHGLSLASRVGKGSRFRLKLKVASPQDNKQAVNGFVSPSLKQFCILVIDDDKIILEGMRITLEAWGHDVYTATNLEDAIITCKQSEPDIIISDFRLHDQITGIDVIQTLRKQLDTNTPALLITGDTAPDRLQQAQKSDLLLLHKPVQPAKLRAALNLL
jgi:CheY-like chemotaxis protein/anti-sigma regulatory factor (Ser/Thr protein kinase)